MSTALTEEQITAIANYERIDTGLVRSISDAAVAHDVPPTMLLAVAKRETDFGRGAGYDAATGLGDGGHGRGMFQLDDRTPAHAPLLAQVQNDPAKAAGVAASMLSESLSDGHPPLDALHIYNHGSLGGRTTSGSYRGRTVNYETAVAGWQHEYDVAAGLAPPMQARERRTPVTPEEQTFVNARIAEAAEKMRGMSTRDAQTHHPELENGNVACAYSVNKVLETALGRTYGENREYVPRSWRIYAVTVRRLPLRMSGRGTLRSSCRAVENATGISASSPPAETIRAFSTTVVRMGRLLTKTRPHSSREIM